LPETKEFCLRYISYLRGLYLLHQNFHWISSGANFYGKHLLFERLYKSSQENADSAAEKIVGLFGVDFLDLKIQSKLIQQFLEKYATNDDIIINAKKAEEEFISFSKEFFDYLEEEEKLSLGMNDLIMQISNDQETAIYLLGQHIEEKLMNEKLSNLAKHFRTKIAQVQDTNGLVEKVKSTLGVYLGNKNWGEVRVGDVSATNQEGNVALQYAITIPPNSPPFVDKTKYPGGLNQFKQEVMNVVGKQDVGNMVQIISVNGQ